MSIWGALQNRLTGYAGLAALVGTRSYLGHLPQSATLPAVSYSQVGEARTHAWGADADVIALPLQVDTWATSVAGVRAVADQVVAALSRWSGTEDTTEVLEILLETRLGPLTELPEDVAKHYRFLLEFTVFYRG